MPTVDVTMIKERMPIVGVDGAHLATVDRLDGTTIKLARDEHGEHHWIPTSWVNLVNDQVHIDRSSDEAKQQWLPSPPHELKSYSQME